MTDPMLHVYDETLGDHYDWQVDLAAMTATLRLEGGDDEWVVLRTHPIREGASGWEYYEDAEQHAQRVAKLESAVGTAPALGIDAYPASAQDLERARRQRVVDALQAARGQGPGWHAFTSQVSAEIDEGRGK